MYIDKDKKHPRLIQIIPVSGDWHAIYLQQEAPYWDTIPVAVWGLFQSATGDYLEDSPHVDGVQPGEESYEGLSESTNFLIYARWPFDTEQKDYWSKEGIKYAEKRAKPELA